MTYLPTPEQFLAEPSTDEDDFEEVTPAAPGGFDPLVSIAASLERIASLYLVGELAETAHAASLGADAAAELEERHQRLNEAYDDLEDKHQTLYELLGDVEKIVAKSKSQVSLEVKAAINAWRNPVVEPVAMPEAPSGETVETPSAPEQPAADASIEEWREYAYLHGIPANDMNRSQIRTALGLPHFDSTPAEA